MTWRRSMTGKSAKDKQAGADLPQAVQRVACFFGWSVACVETHPSGAVIVAFIADPAADANRQGSLFEINLEYVHDMARQLGKRRCSFLRSLFSR